MNQAETFATEVPTRWVGPLRVSGDAVAPNEPHTEVSVPLATYETPLWPSVGRGASISRELELQLVQPGLAQRDLAVLALQQLLPFGELAVALGKHPVALGEDEVVLFDALLHLRDQRGGLGRQSLQSQSVAKLIIPPGSADARPA